MSWLLAVLHPLPSPVHVVQRPRAPAGLPCWATLLADGLLTPVPHSHVCLILLRPCRSDCGKKMDEFLDRCFYQAVSARLRRMRSCAAGQ